MLNTLGLCLHILGHTGVGSLHAVKRELVDEIRFEVARQMLEDSGMEILEISALLDYEGPIAFTRAFRRWSGTTPAKWRTKAKGNG